MSHIFDALQRSNAEEPSIDFPLIASLLTEVPEVSESRDAMEEEPKELVNDDGTDFQTTRISLLPDSRLVSLMDQGSLAAEKFRFLAVRLRQLQQSSALKRLLITSTVPEEGKSMVAANLAITLAQRRQQNILLVEGDLRRPSLCTRLGIPMVPGLCEWLQSDGRSIANLRYIDGPGFWLLAAGFPPSTNVELMQPERLANLMEQVSGRFDWIVIDSPPVMPLADTSVWMRLVDGILLVVREGTTEKSQLRRGLQALEPAKMLGLILNGSTKTERDYYERYAPVSKRTKRSNV